MLFIFCAHKYIYPKKNKGTSKATVNSKRAHVASKQHMAIEDKENASRERLANFSASGE
jgi:hypothetical protein